VRFHGLRRSVLSAACGGMALVACCLLPVAASAATAPSGQVVVRPADGNDQTQLTLTTSGPCKQGTNIIATAFGHGFGRFGQNVIGNSPTSMFATTSSGGMIIPLAETMRYFANIPEVPVVLSGPYRFVVYCRTATGLANLQTFTSGPVTFSAPATRSSAGASALTIVASILGALVLAAGTAILLRRRRSSAGQSLNQPNLGSSTH